MLTNYIKFYHNSVLEYHFATHRGSDFATKIENFGNSGETCAPDWPHCPANCPLMFELY